MKENYVSPDFSVIALAVEDILTVSSTEGPIELPDLTFFSDENGWTS